MDIVTQEILKHLISIFCVLQSVFSDNKGEFDNQLLRNVAELLGTRVIYHCSPFPVVQCHRQPYNAVLESLVLKLTDDSKCSVANALVRASDNNLG